jgi:hypothetical protein
VFQAVVDRAVSNVAAPVVLFVVIGAGGIAARTAGVRAGAGRVDRIIETQAGQRVGNQVLRALNVFKSEVVGLQFQGPADQTGCGLLLVA